MPLTFRVEPASILKTPVPPAVSAAALPALMVMVPPDRFSMSLLPRVKVAPAESTVICPELAIAPTTVWLPLPLPASICTIPPAALVKPPPVRFKVALWLAVVVTMVSTPPD